MIELIRQKRMKDKFKSQFGATIEDFFDEEPIKNEEAKTESPQTDDLILNEEGDEQLLEKLLKANEAIDQIST